MLRLARTMFVATTVAALTMVSPSAAQGSGLDARLAEASAKLDRDSQSCTQIDLGEYTRLLHEAGQNKVRADKAAAKGLPVDRSKIDADLANASALFNRAQAAMIQQCIRGAQQAAQPQARTVGALPGGAPAGGGPTCAAASARATEPDPRPRIPSEDGIRGRGNDMVEAYEKGRHSEAEYLRGTLDQEAEALNRIIQDAKPLGDMANFDVKDAEARLKQINDLLRYADKIGILPCRPDPIPPLQRAQPQPPADAPKQGAMNLTSFERNVLGIHNALRADYGAPPLRWDERLAGKAGQWAGELAKIGRLEHSPRATRGTERENLAQVPIGFSDQQSVGRWVGEKADFVPGTFPNVCRSGGTCDGILHISQMIWPTTTAIGCGKAVGGGSLFVVCYYDPGGNKDGKPVGMPVKIAEVPHLPPNAFGYDGTILESKKPTASGSEVAQTEVFKKGAETDKNGADVAYPFGPVNLGGLDADERDSGDGLDFALGPDWGMLPPAYDDGLHVGWWTDPKSKRQDYPLLPTDEAFLQGGIYWDPLYQVTIGAGANYVDIPQSPRCVDSDYKTAVDAVMNYTSANMRGDVDGMAKAKADLAAAIADQRKLAGDPTEAKVLEVMIDTYTDLTGEKPPGGASDAAREIDTPTNVEQPGLPAREVFNPADLPKCTLEIM